MFGSFRGLGIAAFFMYPERNVLMAKAKATAVICTKVEEEVRLTVRRAADANDRTLSGQVRRILRDWCEQQNGSAAAR